MLKNDFYTLLSVNTEENRIVGSLLLNVDHAIFKGHFPEIPIVPGVVFLQIIKEIIELQLNTTFLLREAKNIKFLDFVNPKETNILHFDISFSSQTSDGLKVQAQVSSNKAIHFKLSARYELSKNFDESITT